MAKSNRTRWTAIAAGLAVSTAVIAQPPVKEEPNPARDPALNDPSIDDDLLDQQRRRPKTDPVAPTPARPPQQAVPGLNPGSGLAPDLRQIGRPTRVTRVYPEGTFLAGRTGTLIRTAGGDAIFLPDSAEDQPGALRLPDSPMVLLPCQKLGQLLAVTQSLGDSARVSVSGQLFAYRDRQYMLPTAFAMVRETNGQQTPASQTPAAQTPADQTPADQTPAAVTPTTEARTADDPEVAELIKELETERGQRLMQSPPAAETTEGENAEQPALTPEGTVMTNRRGRMVRLSGESGRFAFMFDNGPDSPREAPLVLLPSRLLQRMESVAATRGDEIVFNVSGRVLVYDGRNYLLPTLYRVERNDSVRPMQ